MISLKIGLVYCNFYTVNGENKKEVCFSKLEGNVIDQLLKKNFIGGCSMPLILKKAIDEVGKFDEEFPSSQDYDLWIRICEKYERY